MDQHDSITTEKKMSILTILGSGTCVPSLKRSSCAVMIASGISKILVDCGPGTMRRLLEAGTEIAEISHILLSHFHPDHSGELVSFLFSSKYSGKKCRTEPLTLIAGKGFAEFWRGLQQVYGEWIELAPELLTIIEMDTQHFGKLVFKDFTLKTAPMNHRPESLAFRIGFPDNKSLVYSGDTDVSDNLVMLARDADMLICESSFPDELKSPGHLTPSLAGAMAGRANVGTLILTHFYPECEDADIAAQCRKTYSGNLILAEDLQHVSLPS
jgi:ribonuclease BN (tRNA processing enzyme)